VGGIHARIEHRYYLTASGEPVCPHGRSLNQRGAPCQVGRVETFRSALVEKWLVQTILHYVSGKRGALDGLKGLWGNVEGDIRDRFVLAQGLVSSPLQVLLEPRLGAFYLVPLIRNFYPTSTLSSLPSGAKSVRRRTITRTDPSRSAF
jgi:hypothetical protein